MGHQTSKKYETIEELQKDNPDQVRSDDGDYLVRPDEGWKSWSAKVKYAAFIGIGWHGHTMAEFRRGWQSCSKSGHVPPEGYG